MWIFLGGAAIMAGILAMIGVTRARWLGARRWTAAWTAISLVFATLLLVGYVDGRAEVVEGLLGAAAGYVASVGLHTLHHFRGEMRRLSESVGPPSS